jgi:ATP-dependent DNA helicase DinG
MGGVTYAVHSKTLQNQITSDFPEARSLFGRSNYVCLANECVDCDSCFHSESTPCPYKKGKCLYEVQKRTVLASTLRILNFDYLMTESNYVGRFSGSKFNIIDEADILESALINFTTLTFTSYALGRLGLAPHAESLHKTSKDPDTLLTSWTQFAETARIRAGAIVGKLSRIIDAYPENISPEQAKTLKERTRVNRLLEKIKLFQNNVDKSWVLDDSQPDKYIFRPLWLTEELAESFLWRHAKRWVMMSASFLPIHLECKRLGIPIDEVAYKCLPSTFPISRRPIHIESAANMTAKTTKEETPKLVARIKEIVNSYPNVKGLIHAVSYNLSNAIMSGVNSPRLITHNGQNRQEILNMFMESDQPLVLVSPSMARGVSLEQDFCRFIIMAKAPFLSLGDRIVSARVYSSKLGNEWYAASMLLTVLQATGRGMRSDDDWCESYILDEQFTRVFQKRPRFLPQWWVEAVDW